MNANGRRVRQANNSYKHLAKLGGNRAHGRPIYKSTSGRTIAEAIALERNRAAAEARRKSSGKKNKK